LNGGMRPTPRPVFHPFGSRELLNKNSTTTESGGKNRGSLNFHWGLRDGQSGWHVVTAGQPNAKKEKLSKIEAD